jgi:thymidine phosphorylase
MSAPLTQEIIRRKRDGGELAASDIETFIAGLTDGAVSDAQAAAFAMAVFLRGMNRTERVALTQAMARSGETLGWDLPGPVLDKHSTGGVGDAVSLALAPAVAACGGFVPMISGRGLGHTGGTLDKLDAIPGYRSTPDLATFRRVVAEAGCAIIGQTADLAPADRKLYAIRDVTATVESIPLITASILSKKLAAGLGGLVMDVKCGNGAFMPSEDKAAALAHAIVETANGAGLPTRALLTAMDQPLASAAGNAIETAYAIDYLTGRRREPRFHDVVVALGAEMLALGGLAADVREGAQRIETVIANGQAAERFARMAALLGGPADLLEKPQAHLAAAPIIRPVLAGCAGIVTQIETRGLGLVVVRLGGGRRRAEDAIDPTVGLSDLLPLGAAVGPDTPLAMVHARNAADADMAARDVAAAYRIDDGAAQALPLVLRRIDAATLAGEDDGA